MAGRRFRRKAEMALSSLPCAASRDHVREGLVYELWTNAERIFGDGGGSLRGLQGEPTLNTSLIVGMHARQSLA